MDAQAQMSVAHELLSTEEITSTEQILGSGALPGAEENGAEIVYVGIDQVRQADGSANNAVSPVCLDCPSSSCRLHSNQIWEIVSAAWL